MKELFTYVLGVVVCSGFFTLFYRFALHGRISYRLARVFLMASLAAAIAIPALRIPVWKPAKPLTLTIDWQTEVVAEIVAETPAAVKNRDIRPLAAWGIYGCGVAAMLFAMLRQTTAIRRIRRKGKTYPAEDYSLVVSESVASPFSFFSTVYAGADTPPEELRQIIAHELGHIRRRHSAEKMIMEILKTAVWFNPFGWYAARLLNEVHEFEADRDALRGGCEIEGYLRTIFRQAFGYVPEISAGLGHSLTKKRFEMMMKNFKHARFSWLRTVGAVPLAAVMLVLFGFTRRAPEIILRTETEAVPVSDTLEQKTVSVYYVDTDEENGDNQARITVKSYSRTVQDTLKGQIKAIGAGAIRKPGVSGSSEAGMIIRGVPADVSIWDAESSRKISTEELKELKLEEIKNISIWKGDSIPDEIRQMTGEGNTKEIIVINSREFSVIGDGTKTSSKSISVSRTGSTINGKPFIWIAGSDPHEFEGGDLNRIDPNSIASISVLKNKDSYPEEIVEAIGDRSFSGVVIITLREDNGAPDKPVDNPDKLPSFPGGQDALLKWLEENQRYPQEMIETNLMGRVIVRFKVNTDGSLSDAQILQSPHESLSEEVLRLVNAMPDWIPGELNGKPVAVSYTLPVLFRPLS